MKKRIKSAGNSRLSLLESLPYNPSKYVMNRLLQTIASYPFRVTFLVLLLAGCAGGSSATDASRTVTILYTHNTNGLLESCG